MTSCSPEGGCGWTRAGLFTSACGSERDRHSRQLMTLQICSTQPSHSRTEPHAAPSSFYRNHLSHRQFILVLSDFRVLLLMLFTAGTRFCFSTETSPWALLPVRVYKKQIMLLVSVLSDLHTTINTPQRETLQLRFCHVLL